EAYGDAVASRTIVGDLMRFTKFGEYNAGLGNEQIPLGTRLVPVMDTLSVGYIEWRERHPIWQRMGLVCEVFIPPKRNELGDTDKSLWEKFEDGREKDPWVFTNTLVMVRPSDNAIFTFATSSRGGLNAIGELSKIYGKHIRVSPDDFPAIEL